MPRTILSPCITLSCTIYCFPTCALPFPRPAPSLLIRNAPRISPRAQRVHHLKANHNHVNLDNIVICLFCTHDSPLQCHTCIYRLRRE